MQRTSWKVRGLGGALDAKGVFSAVDHPLPTFPGGWVLSGFRVRRLVAAITS